MDVRIYQQSKSSMQSGRSKSDVWIVEPVSSKIARGTDPLMGWSSSDNTYSQVQLTFDSRAEAISYAKREKLSFTVEPETVTKRLVKSYGDNFSADRKQPWTH